MKKYLLTLLAAALVVSMTACGGEKTNTETDVETDVIENQETEVETEVEGETETETEGETDAAVTVGNALAEIFLANNDEGTCEEIANKIIENAALPFMAGAMTVEEGLLTGFDNAEIKGFADGAVFMPMIGSIPFVGYIFEVAEGTDVEEFKTLLSENANQRWNICVTADETVIESEDNKVFFVMCPSQFEDAPADEMGDNDLAL